MKFEPTVRPGQLFDAPGIGLGGWRKPTAGLKVGGRLFNRDLSSKRDLPIMAIDEETLSKGHLRKLNALRKSVGDELGEAVFSKWYEQLAATAADTHDPVAEKILRAVSGLEHDKSFKLGNQGYTIRRAKGKGAPGFAVTKNEKR